MLRITHLLQDNSLCTPTVAVFFIIYRTIPIAKRRYYGRVQEGVHEFLEMGPDVVKGDMTVARIQTFFDPQGAVIVAAKRKDVNGQCTKKDGDCKGREIRDSRYNDMKASMYLLGNAFRTDQQKPPDRLRTLHNVNLIMGFGDCQLLRCVRFLRFHCVFSCPSPSSPIAATVRAARAFFATMDDMQKRVQVKKPKTNDPESVQLYARALDILDKYLDLVELPPIDSGHYDQEFDTLVGETARITSIETLGMIYNC